MTVHDLHDALNLLPSDLITAADRVRTPSVPKVIRWQRWVSLAAVLALVVGTTLVFRRTIGFDGLKGMSAAPESAMQQTPAAAAPMVPVPMEEEAAADEAVPEEPAAEMTTKSDSSAGSASMGTDEKGMEEELYVDHSHRFAEKAQTVDDPVEGYCGNTLTTIYLDKMHFTLAGSYSVAITDILINLDYDPEQTCRCIAEFTVDTETLTGIQVNLDQAFARCERGQAALTEEQAETIRSIINGLD